MKKTLLLVPFAVLAAVPASAAQFQFDPGVSLPAGAQPSGVAAGDFDGDGDRDLAVSVDNPDRLVFLANDGNGGYATAGSYTLPFSSSPDGVVAADFDGDGLVDVAVGLSDFNEVQVLRRTGAFTFSLLATAATGADPRGIAVGDIEGDGDPDLVVANRGNATGTILWNPGSGVLTPQTVTVGLEPRDAAFGDFDGDGDLDFAISAHDGRSISVFEYLNATSGYVLKQTLTTGAQLRPEGLTSGDFDGDGLDDLACAANGNGQESALVFLVIQVPFSGWSFAGMVAYPSGGVDTSGIVAADLDCDGDVDLATSNNTSNNVSLLANDGAAVFGAPQTLATGSEPEGVIAADLDNDGDADLAVPNKLSGNVTMLRNTSCSLGLALTVTGSCPSPLTIAVAGGTPGGQAVFVTGTATGSFPVGNGACAGITLGVLQPNLRTMVLLDGNGGFSITRSVPAAACGALFLQAVDASSCGVSAVVGL